MYRTIRAVRSTGPFCKRKKIVAIKVLIGLGNPGGSYALTRHNIGFRVVDALAQKHGLVWQMRGEMALAEGEIAGKKLIIVKPQTFMNASGRVAPFFLKRGIKADEVLVVHDELEFPFGKVAHRVGGSARGHNGLKSLIAAMGDGFQRLRCGIGRPEDKSQVADYVLHQFSEDPAQVEQMIEKAVAEIEKIIVA